jgi:cold shock CspA family protein
MELTGTVKFFNYNKGFGKIVVDADQSELHLHVSQMQPDSEITTLTEAWALEGEPVIFEIGTTSRGNQAINAKLDLSKRRVGFITEYENGRNGKVQDFHSKEIFKLHYTMVRGTSEKYVRIEAGEPVIFTVDVTKSKPEVNDVVLIDKRYPLEYFAEFQDLTQSLKSLASSPQLAETKNEYWDYIQRPTNGVPVLFSYLNQTFTRIQLQNKIIYSESKDGKKFANFNTGLVTKEQDEIYGYFIENDGYRESTSWELNIPRWKFLEFNTDQSRYTKYFPGLPEMATFFEDTEVSQLIFDTSIKVTIKKEHISKRKHRFPEKIANLDDNTFFDEINRALALATKRAKRNYKTAIPHFYDNKIQFLLPLCMTNKIDADLALVVDRDENSYVAHTVLTLDQAFNNARLLAKPDREWLTP